MMNLYAVLVVILLIAIYYFVIRKPCEHMELKKTFGVPTNLIDPHYADKLKQARLDKLDRAALYR